MKLKNSFTLLFILALMIDFLIVMVLLIWYMRLL